MNNWSLFSFFKTVYYFHWNVSREYDLGSIYWISVSALSCVFQYILIFCITETHFKHLWHIVRHNNWLIWYPNWFFVYMRLPDSQSTLLKIPVYIIVLILASVICSITSVFLQLDSLGPPSPQILRKYSSLCHKRT